MQNKDWLNELILAAIDYINFHRSTQTEIKYLSKPNYPTNQIKTKKKYTLNDEQKEFIKELQLDGILEDIYKLNFNTMRMHTNETILEGIAVITTFEENINQLIAFTKHINQFLLERIKEKLKTAIQASKKISRDAKERCMIDIDKIASDIQRDTETSLTKTQVMLEQMNIFDVFCDKLVSKISYIDLDTMHNNELTNIIQTTKNKNENDEINGLHVILITSLNDIINMKQKLDKKSKENESTRQKIEDIIFFTKDIKAGTLSEQAAKQIKKNMESRKDIFYSILDEIIETKGMIVEAEALVYKILKEMNNKE
ncbi:hypothetical protein BDAP_001309 [Binucleata daphniae]